MRHLRARSFPLLSWVRGRMVPRAGARAGEEAAVIAPGRPRRLRPPVCLGDELDRVLGVSEHDTHAQQMKRVMQEVDENGPTLLRTYQNVLVNRQGAFSARIALKMDAAPRRPFEIGPLTAAEEGLLCKDAVIEGYFGHWIRDGLSLELLARDMGRASVVVSTRRWAHEAGYRAGLGLYPQIDSPVVVGRLGVVEDIHFNDHRLERARRLRSIFQSGDADGAGDRIVFMARGSTGAARRLVNEGEVVAALGIAEEDILYPEASDVTQIRAVLGRARVVVAVEGSAFMHAFMGLREGGGVLVIQPPERFNALSRMFFEGVGIRYGFCVADRHEGGFVQPIDRLQRVMDLLWREVAR